MTNGELLSASRRMLNRITRDLDSIDAGHGDAIDDLAGKLRTTLCFGKGDRLLLRLCNVFHLEMPSVTVPYTLVPEKSPFLVGPLPEWASPLNPAVAPKIMTIPEWMRSQAVHLPGVGRRSWDQVISDFGNTYGAHVSATVPQFLDEIRTYGVGTGTMGAHMLRAAGIVAEHGLGLALAELDGSDAPTLRDHHAGNVFIGMMALTDWGEAFWSVSCDATESVELFSMPTFDGQRMVGTWTYDPETGKGAMTFDWSASHQPEIDGPSNSGGGSTS